MTRSKRQSGGRRNPAATGPGYLPKGGAAAAVAARPAQSAPASVGVPVGRRAASEVSPAAEPLRGRAAVGGWLTTERLAFIGATSGVAGLLGALVEAVTR